MREIKFRAFYNGKMYKVENWMFKVGMNWVIVEDEKVEKIPAESIMQYTNLKDKNDKEIYESDVVANQYGYKFEIVFKDGCWFAGDTEVGFMSKDKYKIIGNIYENPELLGENK